MSQFVNFQFVDRYFLLPNEIRNIAKIVTLGIVYGMLGGMTECASLLFMVC